MSLKANWEANTYNQTRIPRHLSFVDRNFGIPAIQSFLIVVRKMPIGKLPANAPLNKYYMQPS